MDSLGTECTPPAIARPSHTSVRGTKRRSSFSFEMVDRVDAAFAAWAREIRKLAVALLPTFATDPYISSALFIVHGISELRDQIHAAQTVFNSNQCSHQLLPARHTIMMRRRHTLATHIPCPVRLPVKIRGSSSALWAAFVSLCTCVRTTSPNRYKSQHALDLSTVTGDVLTPASQIQNCCGVQ